MWWRQWVAMLWYSTICPLACQTAHKYPLDKQSGLHMHSLHFLLGSWVHILPNPGVWYGIVVRECSRESVSILIIVVMVMVNREKYWWDWKGDNDICIMGHLPIFDFSFLIIVFFHIHRDLLIIILIIKTFTGAVRGTIGIAPLFCNTAEKR